MVLRLARFGMDSNCGSDQADQLLLFTTHRTENSASHSLSLVRSPSSSSDPGNATGDSPGCAWT